MKVEQESLELWPNDLGTGLQHGIGYQSDSHHSDLCTWIGQASLSQERKSALEESWVSRDGSAGKDKALEDGEDWINVRGSGLITSGLHLGFQECRESREFGGQLPNVQVCTAEGPSHQRPQEHHCAVTDGPAGTVKAAEADEECGRQVGLGEWIEVGVAEESPKDVEGMDDGRRGVCLDQVQVPEEGEHGLRWHGNETGTLPIDLLDFGDCGREDGCDANGESGTAASHLDLGLEETILDGLMKDFSWVLANTLMRGCKASAGHQTKRIFDCAKGTGMAKAQQKPD